MAKLVKSVATLAIAHGERERGGEGADTTRRGMVGFSPGCSAGGQYSESRRRQRTPLRPPQRSVRW